MNPERSTEQTLLADAATRWVAGADGRDPPAQPPPPVGRACPVPSACAPPVVATRDPLHRAARPCVAAAQAEDAEPLHRGAVHAPCGCWRRKLC